MKEGSEADQLRGLHTYACLLIHLGAWGGRGEIGQVQESNDSMITVKQRDPKSSQNERRGGWR